MTVRVFCSISGKGQGAGALPAKRRCFPCRASRACVPEKYLKPHWTARGLHCHCWASDAPFLRELSAPLGPASLVSAPSGRSSPSSPLSSKVGPGCTHSTQSTVPLGASGVGEKQGFRARSVQKRPQLGSAWSSAWSCSKGKTAELDPGGPCGPARNVKLCCTTSGSGIGKSGSRESGSRGSVESAGIALAPEGAAAVPGWFSSGGCSEGETRDPKAPNCRPTADTMEDTSAQKKASRRRARRSDRATLVDLFCRSTAHWIRRLFRMDT